MKKISKIVAFCMAVAMILTIMPFSAFAATLSKSKNAITNSDYYNISLYSGNDFINFELIGVDKDGSMTVKENTPIEIIMSDGDAYTTSTYANAGSLLGWHYGTDSTDYCISTDSATTMTAGTYSFTVSGFGTASSQNTCTAKSGNSMLTTLTLSDGLSAGDYVFTLTYKFQMKKWSRSLSNPVGSWSTVNELSTTETINIHVEAETYSAPVGGSIRVGDNAGLRFGFNTSGVKAADIEELGFLYVVGSVDSVTTSTTGVVKKVATNYITHDEGTDNEYTSFNLVFTGVPNTAFDTNISACSYVKVDGVTYYSASVTYNFNQIATKIINDGSTSDSLRQAIQDMLNA